jgi:hypothetical protein
MRYEGQNGMKAGSQTEAPIRMAGAAAACMAAGTFLMAYARLPGIACPSRLFFHAPCPGCGLTRSMEALWHADLLSSFRCHPLGLPLFLLCVAFAVRALCPTGRRRITGPLDHMLGFLLKPASAAGFAVLMIIVWLARLGLALAGNRFFLW